MVDIGGRERASRLIRELLAGRITNDDFDDQYPHESPDLALEQILFHLWCFWDDTQTHAFDERHPLSLEQKCVAERCIEFLGTKLDYRGPVMHVDLFAWPKKIVRKGLTLFKNNAAVEDGKNKWWPFSSEEEYYAARQS